MSFRGNNSLSVGSISDDYEEAEMFYEYFDKRPIRSFMFVSIIIISSIFGLIVNSLIVFLKLRKFKERSIFEWLITTIAFGLVIHSVTYFMMMLSIVTHDTLNICSCYLKHITGDFSNAIIIYSGIILLILVKFNPEISKRRGYFILSILWIVAIVASYPFYEIKILTMKSLQKSTAHNLCIQYSTNRNLDIATHRYYVKFNLEFFIPSIIIIAYGFVTLLFKTPKVIKHKDIWSYVKLVGLFYCLTGFPTKLNMIIFYYYKTLLISYPFIYLNICLMVLILGISPLVYFYYNKKFYDELLEFLRIRKRSDENIIHEFFGDGRVVLIVPQ